MESRRISSPRAFRFRYSARPSRTEVAVSRAVTPAAANFFQVGIPTGLSSARSRAKSSSSCWEICSRAFSNWAVRSSPAILVSPRQTRSP